MSRMTTSNPSSCIFDAKEKNKKENAERIGKMETCDPLNLEPFDPSTFSKTVGETYVMEGGKGALIQGCRVV